MYFNNSLQKLASVSFFSTDVWRNNYLFNIRLRTSEISKNLVLTNVLAELDEGMTARFSTFYFVRHFNFFNFLWFLKRLRYFFRYFDKCSTTNNSHLLLYSDFYSHYPLVLYVSRKNNLQYLLGWISGLWGNRALLNTYVSKTGLQTRFNFFFDPTIIILLACQTLVSRKFLLEVNPISAIVIHFQTLFDQISLYFIGFFSLLVDVTKLSKVYYCLEFFLNLAKLSSFSKARFNYATLTERSRERKSSITKSEARPSILKKKNLQKRLALLRRSIFSKSSRKIFFTTIFYSKCRRYAFHKQKRIQRKLSKRTGVQKGKNMV